MFKKIILILFITFLCLMPVIFKKDKSDKQELVFWTLQLSGYKDYLNPIISNFEKENPDIKIKWIDVPYSEGEKRTLAAVLSNNPPDLVNLNPDFSAILAQKGALEFIPQDKVSIFNQNLMKALEWNGKYYALPFYATSAITIYNRDLAKKSKIKMPIQTYDELINISNNTTMPENTFASFPTLCENDTFLKILNKYNINTAEKINSEKSEKIFETYKNMYTNNKIPKESITQTHREALEKYMSGQILSLQLGANFLQNIKDNAPEIYKNTDVSQQLTGETGKYDYALMNLVVPAKSKHKAEAIDFALYLLNEENQLKFSKLTPVLPVNKQALNNKYFKEYEKDDLTAKARVISASQLDNLQNQVVIEKNKKEILNNLIETTQQILLKKDTSKHALQELSKKWEVLNQ